MSEQVEIRKTICCLCGTHCKQDVYIRNGRLEKVEAPKEDPRFEMLSRTIRSCSKARHITDYVYHPDRLKFPLKRVGEKGEGKWLQISWDQALDEIAEKLNEIKFKYGPEALATSSGTYRTADEYRGRFFTLFGSQNNVGQGYICNGPGAVISAVMSGFPMEYIGWGRSTKCIMWCGCNREQSFRELWFSLLDLLKLGCKFIVVDPRRTRAAAKADIWLQLRPGTDCALYMSMIDVIIEEGLYDKAFVENWCYGFDKLAERARQYPPEKTAEITWVPAEKIREAARMYATNRPAFPMHGMGLEHLSNSNQALHATYILTAITGGIDVKGGSELRLIPYPGLRNSYEIELSEQVPDWQRAKQIGAERFKLQSWPGYDAWIKHAKVKIGGMAGHTRFAHAGMVYRAMLTGRPYPVRAMITLSSNPMVTQANTKLVYKALKSLDLYVVVDYWKTPSAELADYVLPSAIHLERAHIHNFCEYSYAIDVANAALPARVKGEYDRRTDYEFWRGLGIRLGQEAYWPWETDEEALNYRLEPTGYTIKSFMKEKGGWESPPKEERKYERIGFGTPTGKFELYSTILEQLGYDPLPEYKEPAESPISTPRLAKEYPFILITGARHLPFFHSEHRQIDALRKEHPYPLVQINPKTASELGIADGDWVWIESPRGRIRQKCQYFDGIDPRVVMAQHGWWYPEMPGEEPWLHGVWESNINVLTSDEPDQCNEINGVWPLRGLLCKVYKARCGPMGIY
jgi:thiosulfate reductase/polysulfide reductase chain A